MLMMSEQILISEWIGLYKESWKGIIHDDAFAHPAKFSRALIRNIYDHVIAEGWAAKGDSVVDPFGGVALGGFDAMRHGLNWYGCELEEKFVALGGQNIALWNERFSRMPNWGTARLLNGDSRKLAQVLSGANISVSSPPYADFGQNQGTDIKQDLIFKNKKQGEAANIWREGYGSSEGQLGAMKEGDHSIAISSPPYLHALGNAKNYADPDKADADAKRDIMARNAGASSDKRYGPSEGQLGTMPEGHALTVSSPPYEEALALKGGRQRAVAFDDNTKAGYGDMPSVGTAYSASSANLGNHKGETFWSASRLILEQLHQVLAPNGHAVFVVKAFVRDRKIVDFPGQWAQLCEAVGFKLLHDHHALLTEHYGTQGGFEQDKELSVARKSFFRRLAESKGSPKIDYENVLCFEKP